MLNNIEGKLFFINECSSGKSENGFLTKIWKYIFGVPKVVEEEKKEKNLKAACYSKEYEKNRTRKFQRNGKLAGRCYSMITIRE